MKHSGIVQSLVAPHEIGTIGRWGDFMLRSGGPSFLAGSSPFGGLISCKKYDDGNGQEAPALALQPAECCLPSSQRQAWIRIGHVTRETNE